jgi:Rieske 2Fe-2S family protein
MSIEDASPDPGYKGLGELQQSLPRHFYLDADHYQRELECIWYNNWVYVCRGEELSVARSYRVVSLGTQEIIVLRDEQGDLQAFHNTCRHRGSQLLGDASGVLRSDSLTCPYHAWSYSLQGDLKRVPSPQRPARFDTGCLSLYKVQIDEWRGFIFINLGAEPASPLQNSFDQPQALANWPLETLQLGHSFCKTMACNWKVFWENFNECLHCPGIHPELGKLVPLYRQFLMEVQDDPHWQTRLAEDPTFKAGLSEGMQTWSVDGKLVAPAFAGLSQAELDVGHTYVTVLPTVFIVGHADYVRIVSLQPLGPDSTELHVQWLFAAETLADPEFDAAAVAAFAEMVIMQDARVSEINQRGLQALPHSEGVLMPEEYEVYEFQQWVRRQLGE